MLKDESKRGHELFVDAVEEAIKHWTQIWVDAADYSEAISSNVQVCLFLLSLPVISFITHS
jgi:hypothetical protein